jgi:hypothetical protein
MMGMALVLTAIGLGVYFLAPALATLGAALAAPPVILGLAVFAGVMLAIGAAIFIAATGVGIMAHGLTAMFKAADPVRILLLAGFFYGLGMAVPFMIGASYALGILTIAMAAFSLALKFMNFKKLDEFSLFMANFASFEVAKIQTMAAAMRDLSDTIEDMPAKKMILLTTMTATAGMAAVQIGAVAAIPAMAAGAATGVVSGLLGNKKESGGQTNIKQPIVIKFGDTNEVMKEFVINVVGEEVKVVNS